MLKKAETDAELVAKLREWLDEGLTEERNRALFPGLPRRETEGLILEALFCGAADSAAPTALLGFARPQLLNLAVRLIGDFC